MGFGWRVGGWGYGGGGGRVDCWKGYYVSLVRFVLCIVADG